MKVSVICAVYNEEKTFEQHSKSLVEQSYENKEIIIVDDGSTDKTAEIGMQFADKYKFVKYFRIEHIDGYGCVRPRLEAIKHATGDIFCIVDADGYYEKDNIKDGVAKLFSTGKIAAVVPRMHAWSPNNFIAEYRAVVYESRFKNPAAISNAAAAGNYAPWLLKRSVYEAVGGYNIKDAYCEDLRLVRKILDAGYLVVHEPKCHWYHDLGETVSSVAKKNFHIGRMHASEKNYGPYNLFKAFYFSLPALFVLLGLLDIRYFILLGLHPLPMLANGIRLFNKVQGVAGRAAAFYSPVVSYLINVPNAFGFMVGLISPYRKSKI